MFIFHIGLHEAKAKPNQYTQWFMKYELLVAFERKQFIYDYHFEGI
jgi:hypothetical protein